MYTQNRTSRRIAVHAALSIAIWAAVVAGLYWYMRWMVAEDGRLNEPTDGDSYGLPFMVIVIALAVVLLLVNLIVAAVIVRRRTRDISASRPAV